MEKSVAEDTTFQRILEPLHGSVSLSLLDVGAYEEKVIKSRICSACVAALALLVPVMAWAQTGNSGLAGVARDASGALLPGVTVEVASPALIEKVRTVVTGADGSYRILD